MRFRFVIILLFISQMAYSQGINCELGFNEDYDQTSKALVCVDNYSYLIKFQKSFGFFSKCALYKMDTLGNIMFTAQIAPIFAEYINVFEMIPSEANGVYVLGYGMPTCDVAQDCFWFIQKFDSSGSVDWSITWTNPSCNFPTQLTGLSLTENNELLVNYLDTSSTSIVYRIGNNGLLVDSVQVTNSQINGFCELTGYEFLAYQGDSLCAYDALGNIVNTTVFSTAIQNISSLNDSLYVLTNDSVFIFDNNLLALQGSDVTGFSQYSSLKPGNNSIKFVSNGMGSLTLLELDNQLQLQNSTSIPIASNSVTHADFSDSHFSVSHDFPLSLHHTVRYVDYSLSSTQNALVNNADIGVYDVDVTQTLVQNVSSSGVYLVELWATAKVRNYGNNLLNTCKINHRNSPWGICSEEFYTHEFTNLNLAPNDSISINLGKVHSNIYFFSDTIELDLCVYTSHPNQVTDTIVPNDQFCKYLYLGHVGLKENVMQNIAISPNPVVDVFYIENPELLNLSIYIYNNLGQIIFSDSGSGRKFTVDLSNHSKGMHLVRVVSKDGEVVEKIIKQ